MHPAPFFIHVEHVRYLHPYRLEVGFSDGTEREVDLRDELHGEVFEPLRDVAAFAAAYVDQETRTVAWPNGADFAPEFLYALGHALEAASSGAR